MALPNQIDPTLPAGGEDLSLGDDRIRAFKQAVIDIFGLPSATNISNALFGVVAAGLQKVFFQDLAADPVANGQLSRNGSSLKYFNGSLVVDLSQVWVPAGVILPYGGTSAPSGYLLCDGTAYSRTTFATLFAFIGVAYGAGDGLTTFNVPDMKGRIPAGLDISMTFGTSFDVLGKKAGEATHVLTAAEMPTHKHGLNDPGHQHAASAPIGVGGPGVNSGVGWQVTSNATSVALTGITMDDTGGGGNHNNLQPYIVVNYIIKT